MHRLLYFSCIFIVAVLLSDTTKASIFPVNKPVSSSEEKQIARHNTTEGNKQKGEEDLPKEDSDDTAKEEDSSSSDQFASPFDLQHFVQSNIPEAERIKEEAKTKISNELKRDEKTAKAQRKRRGAAILRKAAGENTDIDGGYQ